MEEHAYALRGAGDFVGAPPPPPSPPAAALGIDYGAGGDYVGAPGPPVVIRFVGEVQGAPRPTEFFDRTAEGSAPLSEPVRAGCGSRSPDGSAPPALSGYQPSPCLSEPRPFSTGPWQPPAFLSGIPCVPPAPAAASVQQPPTVPTAASAVLQSRPIRPLHAPSPSRPALVPSLPSPSRPVPVPRAPSLPRPALVPPVPIPSRSVVVPCVPAPRVPLPSRPFPPSHSRLSRPRPPLARLQFPVSRRHPSWIQTPASPVPGTPATHPCTPARPPARLSPGNRPPAHPPDCFCHALGPSTGSPPPTLVDPLGRLVSVP
ncbi:uncharacterized protein LOC130205690 [Pseudoliparis swirei]|uniref:uncharacterized protein LOC130205690 n=1 Tax=Pseudoliparis swirei TaxID=2059687 RepID=UPI0024BECAE3|nr:uncharacterized protein LOC130205690 [Pseudoliparis swirei]